MNTPFLIFLVAWLIGVVTTFIPAFPASLVIFAGAAIAALLDGFQWSSDGLFLLSLGIVTIGITLIDNVASAWGAKKYGGSKWAMWGALIGGLLGMFIPFGLVLGPLAGALVAELLAQRPFDEALKSAWGTLVGLLSGIAAKVVLHILVGIAVLWHFKG